MRATPPPLPHLAVLVLAALAGGCRRGAPGDPGSEKPSAPEAIEQVKERGPVKVTLRVEPREPTFADRVRFTIEAAAKKGTLVTLPSPGENLGEFIIKDYDAPPERVSADATEHRRSYTLEFLTSGDYAIPPMTIAFHSAPTGVGADEAKTGTGTGTDSGTGTEPEPEFKIVTDEIKIHVKPLADPSSLKELAPIAPPAEPPLIAPGLFWPLVALGGLAAASIAVLLLVRAFRRERPPPPPIPPHERAYRELEWLLGQGFIDRGELKEFFFHLSRILREYIEGRFALRAPELTTEEFLIELATRRARRPALPGAARAEAPPPASPDGREFPPEQQRLLREFLQRADLVKFAKHVPGKEEIEGSFESAKRFIEETFAASATRAGGAGAPAPEREEAVHDRR